MKPRACFSDRIRQKNETINRNKREGFFKYMTDNPHYYKWVWGNVQLEIAWEQAKTLREGVFNTISYRDFDELLGKGGF